MHYVANVLVQITHHIHTPLLSCKRNRSTTPPRTSRNVHGSSSWARATQRCFCQRFQEISERVDTLIIVLNQILPRLLYLENTITNNLCKKKLFRGLRAKKKSRENCISITEITHILRLVKVLTGFLILQNTLSLLGRGRGVGGWGWGCRNGVAGKRYYYLLLLAILWVIKHNFRSIHSEKKKERKKERKRNKIKPSLAR